MAENGDGINISFPLSKSRRGRVIKQKAPTMTCVCNFGCLIDGVIRRFTAEELERLQTLPDGYTKYYKEDDGELAEVPRSARESVIGNGWTTDVIVHILKGILPIFASVFCFFISGIPPFDLIRLNILCRFQPPA